MFQTPPPPKTHITALNRYPTPVELDKTGFVCYGKAPEDGEQVGRGCCCFCISQIKVQWQNWHLYPALRNL